MIKLIATDLDGSLLDGQKRHSPRLYPLLAELERRGVLFCMATGRNAHTMLDLFAHLKDRVLMITDNGTTILHKGKVLERAILPKEELARFLHLAQPDPAIHPLGCGERHMYYLESENDPKVLRQLHLLFTNCAPVPSLEAAYDADPFNRVGCYDELDPESHGMAVLAPLCDTLAPVPAGEGCIDISPKGWNKGACLAKVQQRFGISPEETLCFGDYLNDVDLMTHAYYSYAMKNAHPGLKAVCRFETKQTNEEDGVVNTIAELLGITGI